MLKGQVNERSTNPDKFNEFISIHNCTFIILSVVHGGGGGGLGGKGLLFFRIHVTGSLNIFVMQGVGQVILFSF